MSEIMPRTVRVVEVGPRDGLQNEARVVSTADKLRFIEMLADAGLREIEVTSFVNPKRVPQMADAFEIFTQLRQRPGIRYSALVPNRRGLDRALECGVRAIALFTAASETFNARNIGMTIAESLDVFRELIPIARTNGLWVRAYVSTAFVCPYEGPIAPEHATDVIRKIVELDVDEISVGDTIGHAVPDDVSRLTERLLPVLPLRKLSYHFHDTRAIALDNARRALELGVACFDSSTGGTGGCPFAPGAAGNLATERLVAMLDAMGIATGVSLARDEEAARFVAGVLS